MGGSSSHSASNSPVPRPASPEEGGRKAHIVIQLGIEAQAELVEDWYVGSPVHPRNPEDRGHTGHSRDPQSPFYHYITDDVRLGLY